MVAEGGGLLAKVAVNIEHTTVVVPQHADAVIAHACKNLRRIHPILNFLPSGCFLQVTAHDIVIDARTIEDAGQLWHRTGLAMLQPDAGHDTTIPQSIELFIIELRDGLDVQQHHRHLGLLHHWQHRRRKCVGGDEDENEFHLLRPEQRRRTASLFRTIDHAGIDQLDLHVANAIGNLFMIAVQVIE